MSANYGSIEAHDKNVENAKEAVHIIKPSDTYIRRRWHINQNILFGLGHVYNDLCAAMWFSYMMLFFIAVMNMNGTIAGIMLLLGQVVDAFATPLVGLLVDKYSTKKRWHLAGCLLVSCSFPLIFVRCWGCNSDDVEEYATWMAVYYGVLIVFFQIGWAIVQISHLAMIPDISDSLHIRSELTSIRYMASVTSSLMVYLITWIVLRATNMPLTILIEPADDYKFKDVSLIISGIGISAYLIFHLTFKLRSTKALKTNGHSVHNESLITKEEENPKGFGSLTFVNVLRTPLLYQTSLLYVFSRLYWALNLVYVPLYLEERLLLNPTAGSELVASVPFVLYISSFFFSLILKSKISSCGNQMAYLTGSVISLISSLWIGLGVEPTASIIQVYLVATIIGAGSSITLVSSLCITADLIGPYTNQGAAIYSIVTFADKLVTGIAVITIEHYKFYDSTQYYRRVLSYVCGGSAFLGIISLCYTRFTSRRQTFS